VQERNSANTPTVTYTRGRDLSGSPAGAGGIGGLLARSHGYSGGNWASHHAYHAAGNGNVTALANSAGVLQASYRYDPYGRYLAGGGPLAGANVLRFSSKPWVGFAGSATSGLYYYGYRFYDPYLQRWVNRDPIAEWGGFNIYTYTENCPIDVFDPMGMNPIRTGRFWACMADLGINIGISSIPVIGIAAPEVDFVQGTIYGETEYDKDPVSTTLNLGEQSTCGKLNKKGKIVKPKRLMRWNRLFGILGKLWEVKDIAQNVRECWLKGKQSIQ
jgi:RHS repeat-associated protein